MEADPTILASLKEFYTAEEIREFWKAAADALMSRSTLNLHLSQRSKDGSSSAAIVLTTPAEQRVFIASCQRAVQELEGTASDATQGAHPDFSRRMITV